MNILWLADYPLPRRLCAAAPAWVAALARVLHRHPHVALTVLGWSTGLQAPLEELDHDGIHFVQLRAPSVRHDIRSQYQTRIRRVAGYLRRHYQHYDWLRLRGPQQLHFQAAPGLPGPLLLSLPELLAQCVPVRPGALSWRRLLCALAHHYDLHPQPRLPLLPGRRHSTNPGIPAWPPPPPGGRVPPHAASPARTRAVELRATLAQVLRHAETRVRAN